MVNENSVQSVKAYSEMYSDRVKTTYLKLDEKRRAVFRDSIEKLFSDFSEENIPGSNGEDILRSNEEMRALLSLSLEDTDLSLCAKNVLYSFNITNLRQLVEYPEERFSVSKYVRKKTSKEIKSQLEALRLGFGMDTKKYFE